MGPEATAVLWAEQLVASLCDRRAVREGERRSEPTGLSAGAQRIQEGYAPVELQRPVKHFGSLPTLTRVLDDRDCSATQ